MSEVVTLLQPDPQSIAVNYHPNHADGDCVSLQFDDAELGRYLLAVTPQVADHLATLLATATKSVRVQAQADQLRAAQRDRK